MFLRGKTQTKLSISLVQRKVSVVAEICATGFPSLVRQSMASLSTMLLNSLAGVYGDAAVAAMSIVSRISMFVFSFALGIGQGYQPVCAFNYGARKYSRVRQGFLCTVIFTETFLIIMAVPVILKSGSLIQLFRDDPEVVRIGTRALILHCLALTFIPMGTVTEMTLQSTGNPLSASILSSMRSGVILIPLLLILSQTRGLAGIQEAQPLSYVLTMIPAAIMAVQFFKKLPRNDG